MHEKICGIRFWSLATAIIVTWFSISLVGCGSGNAAGESDANGYMCNKCNTKFYTSRKVFAEFCPSCKSYDLAQTVAYVCEKDQHVTMSTKTHGGESCGKCQSPVSAVMLPHEKDFLTWGAAKKQKADVCKM